ncbi:hypothetical protein Tco_0332357 [Tanacetum coccineum]
MRGEGGEQQRCRRLVESELVLISFVGEGVCGGKKRRRFELLGPEESTSNNPQEALPLPSAPKRQLVETRASYYR